MSSDPTKRDMSKTDCPLLMTAAVVLRAMGHEVKKKDIKCVTHDCAKFNGFNNRCDL